MLPNLLNSTTIPALTEVLNFAQARHGVLVGNIANINTPGYRVRDLSVDTFQQRLKEAITQSQSNGQSMSAGIVNTDSGDPMRQVRESLTNVLYHDDTNIDLEKQVTEINKNQFLHNFALTVMGDQMQLLQNAISERV